ncbi:unnamed protein product [Tilletia controversa]|nr:unnamed protein product [Tilletia controversa]
MNSCIDSCIVIKLFFVIVSSYFGIAVLVVVRREYSFLVLTLIGKEMERINVLRVQIGGSLAVLKLLLVFGVLLFLAELV